MNSQVNSGHSLAPQPVSGAPLHYVYLLCCSDGSYYCGYTCDLIRRLNRHSSGKGAKYTRSRRPLVLVYHEVYVDRHSALSREYAIKHISRAQKEELIVSRPVCLVGMQALFESENEQPGI